MAEERHDVARHAAWTAADEDDARAQEWVEPEELAQCVGHKGHDRELCQSSQKDVKRAAEDNAEVVGRERAAHGKHDNAEDDGGTRSLLHPRKGAWQEPAQDGSSNDYPRAIAAQELTDGLEMLEHCVCELSKLGAKLASLWQINKKTGRK